MPITTEDVSRLKGVFGKNVYEMVGCEVCTKRKFYKTNIVFSSNSITATVQIYKQVLHPGSCRGFRHTQFK